MAIIDRLRVRLPEAENDELLNELIQTITDRLLLLIGAPDTLPVLLESLVVDAAVKMYRRIYYEGIKQEGVEGISTNFVDDILAEYKDEIQGYITAQANGGDNARAVRFV